MSNWIFHFDQPKPGRILRSRFFHMTHFNGDLWYSDELRRWGSFEEFEALGVSYSSGRMCRSFKAFKRHLRKHPELLACEEIVLVSRYVGYDIRAIRDGSSHPKASSL